MKVEQKGRNDTGYDNAEGRGKNLEYIVRILDDRGNNETADSLHSNNRPYDASIPSQEALRFDCGCIFEINSNIGNYDTWESHLDVSNVEAGSASFQDSLWIQKI